MVADNWWKIAFLIGIVVAIAGATVCGILYMVHTTGVNIYTTSVDVTTKAVKK